jgi:hypothetical protein
MVMSARLVPTFQRNETRWLYSVFFAEMERLSGLTVSTSTLAGDRYLSRLAFPLSLSVKALLGAN